MFKFVRILEEPCEMADVLKSFMFNNLDFFIFFNNSYINFLSKTEASIIPVSPHPIIITLCFS